MSCRTDQCRSSVPAESNSNLAIRTFAIVPTAVVVPTQKVEMRCNFVPCGGLVESDGSKNGTAGHNGTSTSAPTPNVPHSSTSGAVQKPISTMVALVLGMVATALLL